MDAQVLMPPQLPGQELNQVTVEFDHVQATTIGYQVPRQRALPRPYFHQMLIRARTNRRNQCDDHPLVTQEILAESLAGPVTQLFAFFRARTLSAISIALCIATSRLPMSTRPVPAKSNAVP